MGLGPREHARCGRICRSSHQLCHLLVVTLGRWLKFSEPQFLQLRNAVKTEYTSKGRLKDSPRSARAKRSAQ